MIVPWTNRQAFLQQLEQQGFSRTCLPNSLVDGGITYLKRKEHVKVLDTDKRIMFLIPPDVPVEAIPNNAYAAIVDQPAREFGLIHNTIYKDNEPEPDEISPLAVIHPTAVVGVDGLWFVKDDQGRSVRFKHIGKVCVDSEAEIGVHCVIHRGAIDCTVIGKGVKIGSLCSVGHDTELDEYTILTAGVTIAGACRIGRDCYFGVGSVVKSDIRICDNVVIGAGGIVVDHIHKPGIYTGIPARWHKERDE